MHKAGPRYNREINLETPLSGWFSSFGGGADWQGQLADQLDACRKQAARVEELAEEKGGNAMRPGWPQAVYDKGKKVAAESKSCIESAEALASAARSTSSSVAATPSASSTPSATATRCTRQPERQRPLTERLCPAGRWRG